MSEGHIVNFEDVKLPYDDVISIDRLLDAFGHQLRARQGQEHALVEIDRIKTMLAERTLDADAATVANLRIPIQRAAEADMEIILRLLLATYNLWRIEPRGPMRAVLIDGSQFSPSWRALPGGRWAYALADELGHLHEEYQEALDRHIETFNDENVYGRGPVPGPVWGRGFAAEIPDREIGILLEWEDGRLIADWNERDSDDITSGPGERGTF